MGNAINEIKSLIRRIDESCFGNSEIDEGFMYEKDYKWRDVVGEEAFYDLLAGLKQGNRVTFGYISGAKVEIPTVKRPNPETNFKTKKSFPDYETFSKNLGEEGVVRNVIKLSIYNFPWQTQEDIDKKYSSWKKLRDELGDKYGVQFRKPAYGTTNNNFGERGGIAQYTGNNDELTAHTYTNLNMKGIRPISTKYYLVMSDGHIKPIDVSKLTLLPNKPSTSTIDKLRAAGASEEDVKPLMDMQYQRFEHSKVLFVCATPDTGIPTLLINNKLSNSIVGETGANKEDVIKIAQDRYLDYINKDIKLSDDSAVKLNESHLRKMIPESVKKVLGESCWYGKTEPFETIRKAAEEIAKKYNYTTEQDYEPWDDCDGPDLDPEIYNWSRRVADEAERWIQLNSKNVSVNGGEDW